MREFLGKVVLITGAGSGLGLALAREFGRERADLVLVDVRADRLEAARRELAARGEAPHTFTADVSKRDEMESLSLKVLREKGRVDLLVNNAGVGLGGALKDTSLEDWEWVMGVNFWGVVHGVSCFLPEMIERRCGHIVNVASANGLFSFPYNGAYCASKHAVVGLSESLRAEVAHHGVGVTTVCPGMMKTAIIEDARIRTRGWKDDKVVGNFLRIMERKESAPRTVALATLDAVRENRALVVRPRDAAFLYYAYRLFPWLYRRVTAGMASRQG